MAIRTPVPVEEYLRTRYPNPEPEYRDGEIEERSVPDYKHGAAQASLAAFFRRERARRFYPATETRLELSPDRYVIPDVAVFYPVPPTERFPSSPPLIVIEVLSDDDRMSQVREKLAEYRVWGVPHVWLVDPRTRRLYACEAILHEVTSLDLPDVGLSLAPSDIFD
jgi:Uma2 family endonuclease